MNEILEHGFEFDQIFGLDRREQINQLDSQRQLFSKTLNI